MSQPVISATGLFTPRDSISNEELVESFNLYADRFNGENAAAIAAGTVDGLTELADVARGRRRALIRGGAEDAPRGDADAGHDEQEDHVLRRREALDVRPQASTHTALHGA